MSKHPAYGAIVSMGTEAIPLLLEELAKRADHWFAALNRITGEDPVPVEGRGKLNEMRDAWIHWGRERAYLK